MSYKGSEWRKWDLHVHTPISINQHYGGDRDDVWEKYVSQLEKLSENYPIVIDLFYVDIQYLSAKNDGLPFNYNRTSV